MKFKLCIMVALLVSFGALDVKAGHSMNNIIEFMKISKQKQNLSVQELGKRLETEFTLKAEQNNPYYDIYESQNYELRLPKEGTAGRRIIIARITGDKDVQARLTKILNQGSVVNMRMMPERQPPVIGQVYRMPDGTEFAVSLGGETFDEIQSVKVEY